MVSLGPAEGLDAAAIRGAGRAVAQWLLDHQVPTSGLPANEFKTIDVEQALSAFCEGMLLGAFLFDSHKSSRLEATPLKVYILSSEENPKLAQKINRTTAIVAGVNMAREWSHEPPNIINPVTLAQRAKALASQTGMKCTILGEEDLASLGAGGLLSVGLGSKNSPQLIVLEHRGHGPQAGKPPIIIVGKAITFDTGGYSLKPKNKIVGMKFDKCGGMAVMGIMQAAAKLNLPIPVVGIVAAAENMISSDAYRPNDIITSLSGKTIEIISTDAEGRLVLADALTYAHKQYQPRAMIDLATLTGGVVVALGKVRAGLMSTDDELAKALIASGDRTNERLWRLPLDEAYFELIRGTDSDLKNATGIPQASAIIGGIFLKQFVPKDIPWAHIDIAGTATIEKGKSLKTATGFGVRLLLDYLERITG
jgi:leucyl aminopeptidase